jgi:hypothetical protein
VRILLNTRPAGGQDWHNQQLELKEVPRVGDHVALADAGAVAWHKVVLVVWAAFDTVFDAEVYAMPVGLVEAVEEAYR